MDKIDSFIIHAKGKFNSIEFTFLILEEDVRKEHIHNIVEYIDRFTRNLNNKVPQFKFTWEEAHKIKPDNITEEIIHQILVQR